MINETESLKLYDSVKINSLLRPNQMSNLIESNQVDQFLKPTTVKKQAANEAVVIDDTRQVKGMNLI